MTDGIDDKAVTLATATKPAMSLRDIAQPPAHFAIIELGGPAEALKPTSTQRPL
jgi:hypothetical protein